MYKRRPKRNPRGGGGGGGGFVLDVLVGSEGGLRGRGEVAIPLWWPVDLTLCTSQSLLITLLSRKS